jgi:Tfp pilus assembly protein PilN
MSLKPTALQKSKAPKRNQLPKTRVLAGALPCEIIKVNFSRNAWVDRPMRVTLVTAALVIISVNVLIGLIQGGVIIGAQRSVHDLRTEFKKHDIGTTGQVDDLKSDVDLMALQINKRQVFFQNILDVKKNELPLADLLNAIASVVPERTWITHLELDQKNRTALIRATYLMDAARSGYLPTTEWVDSIKQHELLRNHLASVELKRSERATRRDMEYFDFELALSWTPKKGVAR